MTDSNRDRHRAADGPQLSRRSLLRGGAAAVAGAAMASCQRCTPSRGEGPVELSFAHGPDDSGTLAAVIEAFNREHEGEIEVTWQEAARESDAFFRQLQSDLEAGAPSAQVISADVVWTATLASNGWVRDLTRRFLDAYQPEAFLEPALASAAWRFRIWGVPWYTDAGVLLYRRDLLEAAGLEVPTTWEQLTAASRRLTSDHGLQTGYLFQGADYEGGVANAAEFIWNAGGRLMTESPTVAGAVGQNVMDPNVITVDTERAAAGFDAARALVEQGVTPERVVEAREAESLAAFARGEAAFLRHWPAALGIIANTESAIDVDQVGVAPLPGAATTERRYSCLGGWNLMISAQADEAEQAAAWTFIRHLVDERQQRRRAEQGGFLPTLAELYSDAELRRRVPMVARGQDALSRARSRPSSPVYRQLAPRISRAFNRVLRGQASGAAAAATLQQELQTILRRNR